VASSTLRFVNFLASLHGAVGIANFNGAYFLNAFSNSTFGVTTRSRFVGLVYYVTLANKTAPGGDTERTVAERIQKVGTVEIRDANRPMKAGQEVYKAQCAACHDAGLAGAPKFADAGAWAPRIKTGYEALLNSALKGKNAMGAQGGGDYSDLEIGRAVAYLTNSAGQVQRARSAC